MIVQNDTESLSVKGWTNFINHLETEKRAGDIKHSKKVLK